MISLSNEKVFKIVSGGTPSSEIEKYWDGDINWATLVDLPATELVSNINCTVRKITLEGLKNSSAKLLPVNSILVSTRATIGRIAINKVECSTNQGFKNIIINDFQRANTYFVALMMTKLIDKMFSMATGGTFKELSASNFKTLEIPLPPLHIQEEIVAEIEGYQKIIDGAKMVVENYKPRIEIDPEWEMVQLKEFTEIKTGKLDVNRAEDNGLYPFFTCAKEPYRINDYAYDCEALLLAGNNATGDYDVKHYKGRFNAYQRTYIIIISKLEKALYSYLKIIMDSNLGHLKIRSIGSQTKYLTLGVIQNLQIPLPPLEIQRQIVSKIKEEQGAVNSAKQLIAIFEQKIKNRIAKVWGE